MLDVYRALRSSGQVCDLPVKTAAVLAGWSPRAYQEGLRALEARGWVKRVRDVGNRGGMVARGPQGQVVRAGNTYQITRPAWAYNGQHRRHLLELLADMPQQEALQLLANMLGEAVGEKAYTPTKTEGRGARPAGVHGLQGCKRSPEAGVAKRQKPATPTKTEGRGARPAGVQKVEAAPAFSLKRTKSNSRTPIALRSLEVKHFREKPMLSWPQEAAAFAALWAKRYKMPLYCNTRNLNLWQQLVGLTGGLENAQRTAEAFLARETQYLVASRHALNILLAAWQEYVPLEKADAPARRRAVIVETPSLLERLDSMRALA